MTNKIELPSHAILQPHRRQNPLTGEWVLVSPHRTERPWQGQIEKTVSENRPAYDENCYLCPGNRRAGDVRNPKYTSTFVFTNDFSALLPVTGDFSEGNRTLTHAESVRGTCRVLCFSPRHDLSLAQMEKEDIRKVVDLWVEQVSELGEKYRWVQVFENKGAIMGCSNPHPHGQIWAGSAVPDIPAKEDYAQKRYFQENRRQLLYDYLELEREAQERIVVENKDWAAIVPYWAVWPFETILLPRRHIERLTDLADGERISLADILKRLLTRYDNLFQSSFPYSMGWHGAPWEPDRKGDHAPHWLLHAHFYPPLLRSATIKKFMVGYEMLAEPQRDLTAEQAAERLRTLSEVHYAAK